MDLNSAKMSVLDQIIEAMLGHQMSGLKKKGAAPAGVMAVEVKKDDAVPVALDAENGGDDKDGDEDPEMLKKLMDMYGKGDDEKDENC